MFKPSEVVFIICLIVAIIVGVISGGVAGVEIYHQIHLHVIDNNWIISPVAAVLLPYWLAFFGGMYIGLVSICFLGYLLGLFKADGE